MTRRGVRDSGEVTLKQTKELDTPTGPFLKSSGGGLQRAHGYSTLQKNGLVRTTKSLLYAADVNQVSSVTHSCDVFKLFLFSGQITEHFSTKGFSVHFLRGFLAISNTSDRSFLNGKIHFKFKH